jgi:hypothetical protein
VRVFSSIQFPGANKVVDPVLILKRQSSIVALYSKHPSALTCENLYLIVRADV